MIISMENLIRSKTLDDHRQAGYTVITTNGCFDILTAGHVHYLTLAKGLGDKCVVIVLLNSDSSVKELKGNGRPLVPENERALVLDALECVDFVILFNEPMPDAQLREIKPDIHVKGGDYSADKLPEAALVRSLGGDVITLGYIECKSTAKLISDVIYKWKSGCVLQK